MSDTALSPRLRHLLIQEDRQTGRLIMPGSASSSEKSTASPPLSPMFGYRSPTLEDSTSLLKMREGRILPPPRINIDRRGSQSIFSLLNELRVVSPTSSGPSPRSGCMRIEQDRLLSPPIRSPPLASPRTPLSAPLPYPVLSPYHPHELRHSISGSLFARPEMSRRHTFHPYEYHVNARPGSSYSAEADDSYIPSFGSRAPISRTTKACNACRSRKVRCDAGGAAAMASGEPSTCSRCREAGISCVYSGMQKKRGPCPGAIRPQVRDTSHPSHRSSVTSLGTNIVTPPEEYSPQYSSRSSYGFPPPPPNGFISPPPPPSSGGWSSNPPRPLSSRSQASVLSWPQMEPALEMMDRAENDRRMFSSGYSMDRPSTCELEARRTGDSFAHGRSLPPLRVAIRRDDSIYAP